MTKGFLACLSVIIAAAGLGYWLWSDTTLTPPSTSKLEEIIRTRPQPAPSVAAAPERFSSVQFVEMIDLSSVFEPTGEELALQFLLGSIDSTEYLSMPRVAGLECLPTPRHRAYEALPRPRLIAADTFADADELERLPLLRETVYEALPRPRLTAANMFSDAGEEASSPPRPLDTFRQQMGEVERESSPKS